MRSIVIEDYIMTLGEVPARADQDLHGLEGPGDTP